MAYVVLQQVSSKFARSNARRTLEKPVAMKYLRHLIPEQKYINFESHYPDGKLYIWGAKLERHHQIPKMAPDASLVLFRRGRQVFRIGIIKDILVSVELAEYLWGTDDSGETWGIIFFMNRVRDVSLSAIAINNAIGRKSTDNWQGMTSIDGRRAEAAINYVKQQLELA